MASRQLILWVRWALHASISTASCGRLLLIQSQTRPRSAARPGEEHPKMSAGPACGSPGCRRADCLNSGSARRSRPRNLYLTRTTSLWPCARPAWRALRLSSRARARRVLKAGTRWRRVRCRVRCFGVLRGIRGFLSFCGLDRLFAFPGELAYIIFHQELASATFLRDSGLLPSVRQVARSLRLFYKLHNPISGMCVALRVGLLVSALFVYGLGCFVTFLREVASVIAHRALASITFPRE